MAEKAKINDYGDCVFSEQDVLEILYSNPKINIIIVFQIQDWIFHL